MKLFKIALILLLGAGLTACTAQPSESPSVTEEPVEIIVPDPSENQTVTEPNTETSERVLTTSEVALHATPDDCWMIVENKVYDVTPYIAAQKHPGGAAILEGCGKEATELFMTRPMGSGTPHSENAQKGLQQYYLGELVQTPDNTIVPEE